MNIKLANGERIVKAWDYAVAGNKFDPNKKQCNLMVTNKRIISTIEDKYSLDRSEVSLNSVKSISGSFERNGTIWTSVKLLFGIILIPVIFGIFICVSAIKEKKACIFDLDITTKDLEGSSLSIGAKAKAKEIKKFHLFKSVNKFVVRVDMQTARDILDTLGSIVMNTQTA